MLECCGSVEKTERRLCQSLNIELFLRYLAVPLKFMNSLLVLTSTVFVISVNHESGKSDLLRDTWKAYHSHITELACVVVTKQK